MSICNENVSPLLKLLHDGQTDGNIKVHVCIFANFRYGLAKNLKHEVKYYKDVSHHMVNRNVVVDV
jgi:hypothetical protein